MAYYVLDRIGTGTWEDPYRPEGARPRGSNEAPTVYGALDLAPYGWPGKYLVKTDDGAFPTAKKFADTLDEVLRNPVRNFIQNQLGIAVANGTTARQFMWQVARPLLRPERDGWLRLWIGGELIHEELAA